MQAVKISPVLPNDFDERDPLFPDWYVTATVLEKCKTCEWTRTRSAKIAKSDLDKLWKQIETKGSCEL